MARGVCWYLVGSVVLAALIALAGCAHFMTAEREPWRREAELVCLNSGAVKESPTRARISAIDGPGACGADYPLRVSALGESGPLSYTDEPVRPPSSIPNGALPQRWPIVQSTPLPPPQYDAQPSYSGSTYRSEISAPMSLRAPGVPDPQEEDDADMPIPGDPPHPYYGAQNTAPVQSAAPTYPSSAAPRGGQAVPLGPYRAPPVDASAGSVEVKPAATLACPIVSALDQWISGSVQPAAQRWFGQPVVEIKQISAYSCRGMNGNPNAHISEHAFGNALDIAEFTLADGRKVSVQYGWHGSPEEQGFLHDVQAAACEEFTTVLAPGANVYHYNHIHVDLMRRSSGRHICEPAAIPGAVAAARARTRYGMRYRDPGVTSSIPHTRALGYAREGDERLPAAVPGSD